MKQRPIVCVIDEDSYVHEGWEASLKTDAELQYYKDHLELFKKASSNKGLLASFSCIIIGRHFSHLNLDIVNSPIPDTLKSSSSAPLFLNWQGYITKDELKDKFDGKLFHKYGVRWQTLRLRIQKHEKKNQLSKTSTAEVPSSDKNHKKIAPIISKPERCSNLLKTMAKNASGVHKERIEFYANHDQKNGVHLLEAIYNKLVTDKNRPATCPSKYINSSPVIAKRILHETLFA